MRVRERRMELGWTQAQLAERAGVSRQLVSALESGRHEPGVSAALAIASALGLSVEDLFGDPTTELDAVAVIGDSLPIGPVRVGRVRGRLAAVPVAPLDELDGVTPDGRWTGSEVELLPAAQPAAVVVAGCEPALGLLAGTAPKRQSVLWARSSSGDARRALLAGRAHAATVHERSDRIPIPAEGIEAYELARWRVGLAFDHRLGSAADVVGAGGVVAQRERSAASQTAFTRWLRRLGLRPPGGPRVGGHVAACQLVAAGAADAGVTTEPAAIAAGLRFEAFEEHTVQLWCPRDLLAEQPLAALMDELVSSAFARRLGSLPGYDVALLGRRVA
ncbi:substrate-binding domain-containing protein [Rhabdothermincola sp.]|uniref:substrate-binding domain-containing protein n=1 Tax=Rhabdothermincola sp. TaxID=2820405 RepID=UPI002FE0A826